MRNWLSDTNRTHTAEENSETLESKVAIIRLLEFVDAA